ncbi:MAG: TIGR03067 domain-containing protein [Acidobacteriales bacterium]|nr:TIGR03067 domain-containing protein [Terriglobales bacterium]
MRTFLASLFTLTALQLLVAAQDDPSAKDLKLMQGTWLTEFVEANGKPADDKEKLVKFKITIKADKYIVYFNDKEFIRGTLKLDAGKKPSTIDATPSDGPFKDRVQPGIYKFEGETMFINFGKPDSPRPDDFKTMPGTDQVLQRYVRDKGKK